VPSGGIDAMSLFHMLIPEASTLAPRIDALFWVMVALCGLVAAGVFGAMIFFCVRYHRGHQVDRSGWEAGSLGVELTWMLVPFAMFIAVFVWSLFLFADARTPPADARTLYVVAKQWMWKVQHPTGQREINTLHVALGQAVRLTMTSQDVIHSFFVPAFRVKQDVLPGRYTQLWFTPTRLGTFPLTCTEYCGLDHSKMGGVVVVLSPAGFARWLSLHGTGLSLAARGASLFRRSGCSGCHGSYSTVHAPPLEGVYGRSVHLTDGTTVRADERYLHDSIVLPNKQVVAGYAPVMPSFAGQLSEEDLLALIAYMRSLSAASNGDEPP
jgi:cytochrome c oxidase subunit II